MSTARALKPVEAERTDKREAVRQTLATMRLEGFVFGEKELAVFEKIARGELTTDEARAQFLRELEDLKKERPRPLHR